MIGTNARCGLLRKRWGIDAGCRGIRGFGGRGVIGTWTNHERMPCATVQGDMGRGGGLGLLRLTREQWGAKLGGQQLRYLADVPKKDVKTKQQKPYAPPTLRFFPQKPPSS